MREYMRGYRARFSCLILFLPLLGMHGLSAWALGLSFEEITTVIVNAELLVIEATGFALVIVLCIRHLKHAWKDEEKEKDKEQ